MYSSLNDFKLWAQYTAGDLGASGPGEDESITGFINAADRAIEDYTDQPHGYFEPGGVNVQQEYHDGVEVGYYGVYPSFYVFDAKRRPKLRLDYTPILSVTTLEHQDSAGNWTTYTEGRTNDYLVFTDGVRYIQNIPRYDYKNVRVSYVAGYAQTPGRVAECSARLAAAMFQRVKDSQSRKQTSVAAVSVQSPDVDLTKTVFTRALKGLVRRYKRRVPPLVM